MFGLFTSAPVVLVYSSDGLDGVWGRFTFIKIRKQFGGPKLSIFNHSDFSSQIFLA
jgi:hypothetical protein